MFAATPGYEETSRDVGLATLRKAAARLCRLRPVPAS
jgi:hypothetical protein